MRAWAGLMGVTCAAAAAQAGPIWCESLQPADAGSLPPSAQVTMGVGPLAGIEGALDGGRGDFEDAYKITITDPMNFKASTQVGGVAGISTFDTQLWLFDQNGLGLLANNDAFGMATLGSEIRAPATDGTGQIIPVPGIYYLAITGFGNDALSIGGPIFNIIADEISGPDGPGALQPVSAWTGRGATGEYVISLIGASFAEAPAPGGLSAIVVGLLMRRGRRRAA